MKLILFIFSFFICNQVLFSQEYVELIYQPKIGDTLNYRVDIKYDTELEKNSKSRLKYKLRVICRKTDSTTHVFKLETKHISMEPPSSSALMLDYCEVMALSKIPLVFTNTLGSDNILVNQSEIKIQVLKELVDFEKKYVLKNDQMTKATLLKIRSSNDIEEKTGAIAAYVFNFSGFKYKPGKKEVLTNQVQSNYSSDQIPAVFETEIGLPDTVAKQITFSQKTNLDQKALKKAWKDAASFYATQSGKKMSIYSNESAYQQYSEYTSVFNYETGIEVKMTVIDKVTVAGLKTVKDVRITLED